MKNASDLRVNSILRICVGLLLVPATVFLLALFLCTGQPYPPTLIPWEQLGFRYWIGLNDILKDRTPRFCCFSACGDYYGTVIPRNPDGTRELFDLQIFDLATRQPFCLIEGLAYVPSAFRLSLDKQLVQVEAGSMMPVYVWPSGGGKTLIEREPHGLEIGGVYNSEAGVIQAYARLRALMLNTAPDPNSSVIKMHQLSIKAVYFNRGIPPKAFVHARGVIELWDLASQRRDWQILGPFFIEPLILPDQERFVTVSGFHEIQVRSLEDGRVFTTYSQDGVLRELRMTPDGRFLFLTLTREPDLTQLARSLSNRLADWMIHKSARFDSSDESVLLDLETGKCWPQMAQGARPAALAVTHGYRPKLIRVSARGWCEWDSPPQWRWISPWAWYGLTLWLILVVAWRGLRRSQPAIEKERITKKSS